MNQKQMPFAPPQANNTEKTSIVLEYFEILRFILCLVYEEVLADQAFTDTSSTTFIKESSIRKVHQSLTTFATSAITQSTYQSKDIEVEEKSTPIQAGYFSIQVPFDSPPLLITVCEKVLPTTTHTTQNGPFYLSCIKHYFNAKCAAFRSTAATSIQHLYFAKLQTNLAVPPILGSNSIPAIPNLAPSVFYNSALQNQTPLQQTPMATTTTTAADRNRMKLKQGQEFSAELKTNFEFTNEGPTRDGDLVKYMVKSDHWKRSYERSPNYDKRLAMLALRRTLTGSIHELMASEAHITSQWESPEDIFKWLLKKLGQGKILQKMHDNWEKFYYSPNWKPEELFPYVYKIQAFINGLLEYLPNSETYTQYKIHDYELKKWMKQRLKKYRNGVIMKLIDDRKLLFSQDPTKWISTDLDGLKLALDIYAQSESNHQLQVDNSDPTVIAGINNILVELQQPHPLPAQEITVNTAFIYQQQPHPNQPTHNFQINNLQNDQYYSNGYNGSNNGAYGSNNGGLNRGGQNGNGNGNRGGRRNGKGRRGDGVRFYDCFSGGSVHPSLLSKKNTRNHPDYNKWTKSWNGYAPPTFLVSEHKGPCTICIKNNQRNYGHLDGDHNWIQSTFPELLDKSCATDVYFRDVRPKALSKNEQINGFNSNDRVVNYAASRAYIRQRPLANQPKSPIGKRNERRPIDPYQGNINNIQQQQPPVSLDGRTRPPMRNFTNGLPAGPFRQPNQMSY